MRTVTGEGCWPGRATGTIVWLSSEIPSGPAAPGFDTPAEGRATAILTFRAEAARAAADVEAWCDGQQTLEQRIILQGYKEALLEDAWQRRVCTLIDVEGVPPAEAAVRAAGQIAALMLRSDGLRERAGRLEEVSRWLAHRLTSAASAGVVPADAILATTALTPLAAMDLKRPALLAGPEPPVRGSGTLVWGVAGLGLDWAGLHATIDGAAVTLEVPAAAPRRWRLEGSRLNGLPVCTLNGSLELIRDATRRIGRPPAVLIRRLDDLAALPLYAAEIAAAALDLDSLGPAPRLKHPGFALLLEAALQAAKARGLPMVVGGENARRNPDYWLSLGFTDLYDRAHTRGDAR